MSRPAFWARLDRPGKALVAGTIAGLLAVIGLIAGGDLNDSEGVVHDATASMTTRPATSLTTAGVASSQADPAFKEELDEMVEFVQRERGLKFKSPPVVTLLPPNKFVAKLTQATEQDKPSPAEEEAFEIAAKAAHFVKPSDSVAAITEEYRDANVLGFYDPRTKATYVRGGRITPFVRSIIVHELTHALQDQWFGVAPDLEDRVDESFSAYRALVEGDAIRMDQAYQKQFTPEERREYFEEAYDGYANLPTSRAPALEELFNFPYITGAGFAEHVAETGGNKAVDRAFKNFPKTSEQILHPSKYFDGEGIMPVDDVVISEKEISRGVWGEFTLRTMLSQRMPALRADRAARGWGGDRYVTYRRGGQSCLTILFVMDSAAETKELQEAFDDWIEASTESVVSEGSGLRLTSCV